MRPPRFSLFHAFAFMTLAAILLAWRSDHRRMTRKVEDLEKTVRLIYADYRRSNLFGIDGKEKHDEWLQAGYKSEVKVLQRLQNKHGS